MFWMLFCTWVASCATRAPTGTIVSTCCTAGEIAEKSANRDGSDETMSAARASALSDTRLSARICALSFGGTTISRSRLASSASSFAIAWAAVGSIGVDEEEPDRDPVAGVAEGAALAAGVSSGAAGAAEGVGCVDFEDVDDFLWLVE